MIDIAATRSSPTTRPAPRPVNGAVAPRPRRGVLALAGSGGLACVLTLVIEGADQRQVLVDDMAWFGAWSAYLAVGVLVVRKRPDLPLGGVLVGAGLSVQAAGLLDALAHLGHSRGWPGPLLRALATVSNLGFLPAVLLVGVCLPLLFPAGILRGRAERLLLRLGVLTWSVFAVGVALSPGDLATEPVPNPVALTAVSWLPRLMTLAGGAALALVAAACVATLAGRWRRAPDAERTGLAYLAMGVLLQAGLYASATVARVAGWDTPGSWAPVLTVAMVAAPPVLVGIGILQASLFDIELVLRRSLTYAAMTLAVLAAYCTTILLVGRVVDRTQGLSVSLLVIGLAAVGLSPLRERAQRQVDRMLYGRRADPYGVLRDLDTAIARAEHAAEVLPSVTATIARALKLPYVAIQVGSETTGHGRPAPTVRDLPLSHHGRRVGSLQLSARSPGEQLSSLDDRLLADVADHVASAVAAVALAEQAQHSRERLVHALEEDRRRIRRDLHDHLGPVLSGITLQLDALRRLTTEPAALDLTEVIRAEVADAVVDLRRLVHDLRPPVLDELGLAEALRQHADLLSGQLPVHLDLGPLPPLPAAVEVAAYRIATEALTNVLRHADAGRATLALRVTGSVLRVRVSDDGRGLDPAASPGVGLQSMRERVAELGGRLALEAGTGSGTVVTAELPL